MQTRPLRLGLALCALAAGCSSCRSAQESKQRQAGSGPQIDAGALSSTGSADSGARVIERENEIRVTPLKAASYRIDPQSLPAPFDSDSARKSPKVIAPPAQATLQLPVGFRVTVFARNLSKPRWLALTPDGDVLVTETRLNRIIRFRDSDGDGVADERFVFAGPDNGLNIPFGMAFAADKFFLGNSHEVRRYAFSKGQVALRGRGDSIAELPGGGYRQHWTRNVIPTANGKGLYVSIGSRTNADEEAPPRASIQHIDLDGQNMRPIATGLRNPVGLALHPTSGDLYTTVNERDGLGDDLVPDYFTRVQPGDFFGWPYAYLLPSLLDPRMRQPGQPNKSIKPIRAAATRTPDVLFQAHSAALGLQFYTGNTFPQKYRNGAFVAFRGSWNRSAGTGYKLVFIPFKDGRPTGNYEDFLSGFLIDPAGPTTWGRPVGLLVAPDGSLLFTEEMNGRIYRIQYQPPHSP